MLWRFLSIYVIPSTVLILDFTGENESIPNTMPYPLSDQVATRDGLRVD